MDYRISKKQAKIELVDPFVERKLIIFIVLVYTDQRIVQIYILEPILERILELVYDSCIIERVYELCIPESYTRRHIRSHIQT
jgi:hypothetical protein